MNFYYYSIHHIEIVDLFRHFTDDILSQTEKQRYDGWFNNLAHPEWGSVGE